MRDHLKGALIGIGFIQPRNPDCRKNGFRRFSSWVGLTAKEVRLIRGVHRQINGYGEERFADDLATAATDVGKTPPTPQTPLE